MCQITRGKITYYQESENNILTFKDHNKNIAGQYDNVQCIGYVGKKTYKSKIWWLRAIAKAIGTNI